MKKGLNKQFRQPEISPLEQMASQVFESDQVTFMKKNLLLDFHLNQNKTFIDLFQRVYQIITEYKHMENSLANTDPTVRLQKQLADQVINLLRVCIRTKVQKLQVKQLARICSFFEERLQSIRDSKDNVKARMTQSLIELSLIRQQKALKQQAQLQIIKETREQERAISCDINNQSEIQRMSSQLPILNHNKHSNLTQQSLSRKKVSFDYQEKIMENEYDAYMPDFNQKRAQSKTVAPSVRPNIKLLQLQGDQSNKGQGRARGITLGRERADSVISKHSVSTHNGGRQKTNDSASSKQTVKSIKQVQQIKVPLKYSEKYFKLQSEKVLNRSSALKSVSDYMELKQIIETQKKQKRLFQKEQGVKINFEQPELENKMQSTQILFYESDQEDNQIQRYKSEDERQQKETKILQFSKALQQSQHLKELINAAKMQSFKDINSQGKNQTDIIEITKQSSAVQEYSNDSRNSQRSFLSRSFSQDNVHKITSQPELIFVLDLNISNSSVKLKRLTNPTLKSKVDPFQFSDQVFPQIITQKNKNLDKIGIPQTLKLSRSAQILLPNMQTQIKNEYYYQNQIELSEVESIKTHLASFNIFVEQKAIKSAISYPEEFYTRKNSLNLLNSFQ